MSTVRRGASWAAAFAATRAVRFTSVIKCTVALALVTVSLSGCRTPEPVATSSPSPSASPVFASEEEALAAATEAYARYLEVSDAIGADGGTNPERLAEVATSDVVASEASGFDSFVTNQWRQVGPKDFDTVTVQSFSPDAAPGVDVVSLYLCLDVSAVDVVDSTGASVVSDSRPPRSPFEVRFKAEDSKGDGQLIVSGKSTWNGENFCAP